MIVSVVMPAYNAENTVAAAVGSVLAQTMADLELIIVDDCSTDGTWALCQGFAASDGRVRVLRNAVNEGVAETRNRGVREARGEWIAFLDSDDLWSADKLEKQMAFIAATGAVISYTASAFMDANGRELGYILRAERELAYDALLRRNLMSCSSVVVRRNVIQRFPFPSGPLHEDYAAWLMILREAGTAYGLDEPLLTYRASRDSRSGRLLRSGMMVYRTYRAVGYGAARAGLMTVRYAGHSLSKRRKMGRNDTIY